MQPLLPVAVVWAGLSVLHVGDSHVASGLTAGLRAHFAAEGARYRSDYWVSASTARWAYSDRLRALFRRHRPDVVILTLGSNEARYPNRNRYGEHMTRLLRRIGDRTCYWIGPPTYDRFDVGRIVEWQREFAGRCRYFDSRGIDAPRGHTRLHFTREGGLAWADAIWAWMNSASGENGEGGVQLSAATPRARPILQ